jgi:tRNA U55 pseudouridine synthase TruB
MLLIERADQTNVGQFVGQIREIAPQFSSIKIKNCFKSMA